MNPISLVNPKSASPQSPAVGPARAIQSSFFLAALLLLLTALTPAWAATSTWSGLGTPDVDWTNTLNWSGTLPPFNNTSDLIFTNNANADMYLGVSSTVQSLTFSNSGGSLRIIMADTNGSTARTLTLDSASGNPFITIAGSVAAANLGKPNLGSIVLNKDLFITNNNTSGGFNFGNGTPISGAHSITIVAASTGTGPVTFRGNNTFSGGLNLNHGMLSASSFGNETGYPNLSAWGTGNLTIAAGTILQNSAGVVVTYTTPIVVNGGFTLAGNNGMTLGGTMNLATANPTITMNNTAAISGVISDSGGGFTKAGAGTLVLSGANTYSGTTTVSAGTLIINSASALGTGPLTITGGNLDCTASSAITNVNNNAQNWNSGFIFTGTTNLNLGTGAVTLGANPTQVTVNSNSLTVGGVVGGANRLNFNGPGALILSGANTFTNYLNVYGGTLTLSGARTADFPGQINVSGSYVTGATNATLNIQNGNFTVAGGFLVGNANGNGTVNQSGGTISLVGNNDLFLGQTPTSFLTSTNGNTYNLSGGTLSTADVSQSRGVVLCALAGAGPAATNLQIGSFNLSGTGVLSMPAATLMLGRWDNTSRSNQIATFFQTGGTATFGWLAMGAAAGGATNEIATLNLTGGTFLATNFYCLAGGATNIATITIGGTADVTLPAFPTAHGSGSTATITFDGGTLRPAAASTVYLQGLTSASLTTNGANFAVASGNNITVAQVLQNASAQTGILTKSGVGTLTLTGTNTYTGTTTVSTGTLLVNGSISNGAVAVNGGALGGSGTIGGAVTVASGATLQPGSGVVTNIATLTINSNLTLSGTALLALNRTSGQTASLLTGINTLTRGGTLTVTNVGSPLQANDSFTLFSAASDSGNFSATNLPTLGAGTNWWTTNDYKTILVNKAPTAGSAAYSRVQTNSLRITITDLLTNVTGTSVGQTITLQSVGSGSQGATISSDGTYVNYIPVNSNSDSFTYTVSDGRGGTSTGNIAVNVIQVTGQNTGVISISGTTATTLFEGIPTWVYIVQRSTNLSAGVGWVAISTNTTPASGLITNIDTFSDISPTPPPYPSSAYYRLQSQ